MGPASSFVNGGLDVAELAPVMLQQVALYASSSKPSGCVHQAREPSFDVLSGRTHISDEHVYRLYEPHCSSSNRRVLITGSHPSPVDGSRTTGNHLGVGATINVLR